MKILYQLAPYIKQASTQSQWHAMVCIDPDWSAGPSARIALPQALTGRKALLPSAGLRWGGLIWHHISSLWYRGNTLRQSSSHGRGRDRTSKTDKVSEGLGLKLIMCHFHLILLAKTSHMANTGQDETIIWCGWKVWGIRANNSVYQNIRTPF